MSEAVPWGAAVRHAATAFGIAPEGFWRLSLVEWRVLVGPGAGVLGRAELEGLMRAFPDGNAGVPSPDAAGAASVLSRESRERG